MTEVLNKTAPFNLIGATITQLTQQVASLEDKDFNKIPFEGSWNAGQLLRHVTKSIDGMANLMLVPAAPVDRNPEQKIAELRGIFLNYENKMEAPEFIVPEDEAYKKQQSIDELNQSFKRLNVNAEHANLNDLIEDLPFGATTKLEILHFVLFHTQRHQHQLQKICAAL
mgnify:CR=1 FL=1